MDGAEKAQQSGAHMDSSLTGPRFDSSTPVYNCLYLYLQGVNTSGLWGYYSGTHAEFKNKVTFFNYMKLVRLLSHSFVKPGENCLIDGSNTG